MTSEYHQRAFDFSVIRASVICSGVASRMLASRARRIRFHALTIAGSLAMLYITAWAKTYALVFPPIPAGVIACA